MIPVIQMRICVEELLRKIYIYKFTPFHRVIDYFDVSITIFQKHILTSSNSVHKSESSPDRQALLRKANAKLSAARDPTRARPSVAFSPALRAAETAVSLVFLRQWSCPPRLECVLLLAPSLLTLSGFDTLYDDCCGSHICDRFSAIRYLWDKHHLSYNVLYIRIMG